MIRPIVETATAAGSRAGVRETHPCITPVARAHSAHCDRQTLP